MACVVCCVFVFGSNLASIKSYALRQGCAAIRSFIQIPMEMRYTHAHGNKNRLYEKERQKERKTDRFGQNKLEEIN